jgi:antitoxin (DNA-binding transcriptional repressor) of toxin-antitoxin stability system
METNISNLKAHLSETLDLVKNGEVVTILDRTHPIAIISKFEDTKDQLKIRPSKAKKFRKRFQRKISHSVELFYDREER